jgi:hypothetical protein
VRGLEFFKVMRLPKKGKATLFLDKDLFKKFRIDSLKKNSSASLRINKFIGEELSQNA